MKRIVIFIFGLITYYRLNHLNKLRIEGVEHLRDLPVKNVLFVSNHQTYFMDVASFIFIFGQVTTPTLITNSGGTFSNSSVIMDFSIRELAVQTLQNNEILTQGFHQGDLKVTTAIFNLGIKTKIYPNPTTKFIIIELEKNVNADILVYDINGKIVIEDKLNDENQKQLDFSFLKQGNYLLHINVADKQSVYQINKTK